MLFRCKVHLSHARIIPNDNRYFGRSDQKKLKFWMDIVYEYLLRAHTHTHSDGRTGRKHNASAAHKMGGG